MKPFSVRAAIFQLSPASIPSHLFNHTDIRYRTVPESFIAFFGSAPLRSEAIDIFQRLANQHAADPPTAYAEFVRHMKRGDVVATETARLWALPSMALQATAASLLALLCRMHDPLLRVSLAAAHVVRGFAAFAHEEFHGSHICVSPIMLGSWSLHCEVHRARHV
jgi:hypothetical protein